jgi:hypothetical protein
MSNGIKSLAGCPFGQAGNALDQFPLINMSNI